MEKSGTLYFMVVDVKKGIFCVNSLILDRKTNCISLVNLGASKPFIAK